MSSWVSPSAKSSSVGASFTGFTVNVNVVLSDNSPSVTVTVISISPLKSAVGLTVNWFPSTISSVFPFSALKVKLSPSTSLAESSIDKEVSSSIVWLDISDIIGASVTGLISIVTNPLSDDKLPSVTLYSTTSKPFKSVFGV